MARQKKAEVRRGMIRFAHGKESGPWGAKIQRLAEVAERHGFAVESPDYSATQDPDERVRQLEALGRPEGILVLVGSSMGGYVSTVASTALRPEGLFLMAPAFYLPAYGVQDPVPNAARVEVVHGWGDAVVPASHAVRFAERHRARLHLLPDGHRLMGVLPEVEALFDAFLGRFGQPTVVFDTNVFVAAGFKAGSASARLVAAVEAGRLRLVWDEPTREESAFVVGQIPPLDASYLKPLFQVENRFDGTTHPAQFTRVPDPDDWKFAALAAATGAALVTQDDHLLGRRDDLPVLVLTPGEAAARYLGDSP